MSSQPHWAESLARALLENKGWRYLDGNVRYAFGEVDLVMLDGETLVFVEVRQRASERYGGAAASIDARKLARVRRVGQLVALERFGTTDLPMRVDAVLVRGTRSVHQIEHLTAIA